MTHLNLIRQDSANTIFLIGGVYFNPCSIFFIAPIGKKFAMVDIFITSVARVFTAFYSYAIALYINIYRFCFLKVFKDNKWLVAAILSFNAMSVSSKFVSPCIVNRPNIFEFFNFFAKGLLSEVVKRFLSGYAVKKVNFEVFIPFIVCLSNFWCIVFFEVFSKRFRG